MKLRKWNYEITYSKVENPKIGKWFLS